MCGIAGILIPGRDARGLEPVLDGLLDGIKHRGPDDCGRLAKNGLAIGMRRLSIIDIKGGHQPMTTADDRFTIVYNGEVYNFRELRQELEAKGHSFRTKSDTEVILQGYAEWGEDIATRLNGMFAFALLDHKAGTIFLARDHFGVKPLYYVRQKGLFAFCSEPKPLMELPGLSLSLDLEALETYLAYKYVPAPRTFVNEIKKLTTATALTLDVNTLEIEEKKFWQLAPEPLDLSIEQAEERLGKLLTDAVRRQMVSDVPLGLFLSGGIDSGLLLHAACQDRKPSEVNSHTLGFEEKSYDETEYAKLTAEHLGATHRIGYLPMPKAHDLDGMVDLYGEPFANTSIPPCFLLSKSAVENFKVALSGSGGDELFGGYDRYFAVRPPLPLRMIRPFSPLMLPLVKMLPVGAKKNSLITFARRFFELNCAAPEMRHALAVRLFMPAGLDEVFPGRPKSGDPITEKYIQAPGKDGLQKAALTDIATMMADDYLTLADRTSMAASLELRVPFLDLDLAQFSVSLPSAMKIRGWEKKFILRRYSRGKLPDKVVTGAKKGFESPVGAWFRGELGPALMEKVRESEISRVLDAGSIKRLVDDHKNMRVDGSKQLLGLYTLAHWTGANSISI